MNLFQPTAQILQVLAMILQLLIDFFTDALLGIGTFVHISDIDQKEIKHSQRNKQMFRGAKAGH